MSQATGQVQPPVDRPSSSKPKETLTRKTKALAEESCGLRAPPPNPGRNTLLVVCVPALPRPGRKTLLVVFYIPPLSRHLNSHFGNLPGFGTKREMQLG